MEPRYLGKVRGGDIATRADHWRKSGKAFLDTAFAASLKPVFYEIGTQSSIDRSRLLIRHDPRDTFTVEPNDRLSCHWLLLFAETSNPELLSAINGLVKVSGSCEEDPTRVYTDLVFRGEQAQVTPLRTNEAIHIGQVVTLRIATPRGSLEVWTQE